MARRQNTAKVVTTGIKPVAARPPAAAIIFCSAMPNCSSRLGWDLRKWCTPVPPAMSASSTTKLGNSSPSADKALPKASRNESLLAIRAGLDMEKALDFLFVRAQSRQSIFGLRVRQLHAAVPGGNIFHNGHAFALDGVGDDQGRAPMGGAGFAQRAQNLRNIVTVDLDHIPAEGAPFVGERLQPHDRRIGIV